MAKNKLKKNTINALLSPENYIRNKAQNLPLYECLINKDWNTMGLASILISRRQPSGNIIVGTYLVDVFCLGLKNTLYAFNLSLIEYEKEYKKRVFAGQTAKPCDYVLAHNIIFGAIEYAEDIGFKPNKDFALTKFILNKDEEVEVLEDLEFGKDGDPFYITGPLDNVNFILNKLNQTVGEGNYQVVYADPIQPDDDDDDDDDDDYDGVTDGMEDIQRPHEGVIKMTDKESGKKFCYTEYSVSYEPMSDPNYEKFIEEAGGEAKMEELHGLVHTDPQKAIGLLKQIISDHPNIPSLYNYLAVALESCKQPDESLNVVKTVCEKFPDYLFGKVNYLSFLIKDGKIDEATKILDGKFDIKMLYPERNVFHITEVTAFLSMIVSYFIAVNKIEAAQSCFTQLKSLSPKHVHIKRLKLEFIGAKLKRIISPLRK